MSRLLAACAATVSCLALSGVVATAQEAAPEPGTMTAEILVQGAPIHGANGLAVDGQGRVLVASVWGREVAALDPTTGEILEHIGPVVGDADIGSPDDVAVGPDGSVCMTDIIGGRVACLRTDGTLDQQFVAQGVNPIAFMPDGRLFVALAFFGDDLYELDPALQAAPRLVMEGEGDAPWPNQLNGFDFGPDGLLYAPRPFSAEIGRIDVDAPTPTFETLTSGVSAGAVDFDADGVLHASLLTGEVATVDVATGAVTPIAALEPDLDNMAFGPEGQTYVSNSHDGRIDVIEPDGQVRQLSAPGLILPGGIAATESAVDGSDHLYVTDLWSLAEFDGQTGEETAVTAQSLFGGSITEPWTVAADGDNVIITSWMSNLVQIWDVAAGKELASWPDFAAPVNAIRLGQDLVVAELGTGSVVRQTPDGVRSTIADGLMVPSGLAASGDDLWVTDWATGTVWQIMTDGLPSVDEVATGLVNPEGIAVDHDGSLLVVESGLGRLTRILASTATETVVDGLPIGAPAHPDAPPAWAFNGVAVGPSGTIYLTGDKTSTVWRVVESPTD